MLMGTALRCVKITLIAATALNAVMVSGDTALNSHTVWQAHRTSMSKLQLAFPILACALSLTENEHCNMTNND